MAESRIVVIGASAGGVEAMLEIASALPPDFDAPICLVIHIPAESPSILPDLLARRGRLEARHPENGERYERGTIYVAPPDHHLLIENGAMRVVRGPRENRHRPAIDPLFRSAAVTFGPRAIGVILSGSLDDGTAGLLALKKRGGIAVVQDPSDAMHPSMPRSAIANVDVDIVAPLRDIAPALTRLLQQPHSAKPIPAEELSLIELETRIAGMDSDTMKEDERPGKPSAFSCPDCGGVLWEIEDGNFVRFRCRVGHAYSPDSMLGAQNGALEEALWAALQTLEGNATLAKRLAITERQRGHEWMAVRFDERERDARERAEVIRRLVGTGKSDVPQVTAGDAQANRRRRR